MQHGFLAQLEQSQAVSAATGWLPQHLYQHDSQGQLAGFQPGYVKQHSFGEYVFDQPWAQAYAQLGLRYYPKWLFAVPFSPITGPRLLGLSPTDFSDFVCQHVHEQQWSSAHLLFAQQQLQLPKPWVARLGMQFRWHRQADWHSFDDFLASLKSRKRKQIRKERQSLAGIEFIWRTGEQISAQDLERFYQDYQNTYAQFGRRGYLSLAFFAGLVAQQGQKLRLLQAKQGESHLASALYLVDQNCLYGRYWGSSVAVSHLHFELCYYQGIDYCLAHNLQEFDPGTQGEQKLLRGFEPCLTYSWHYLADAQMRGLIRDHCQREALARQQQVRDAREFLPYK